MVVKGPMLWLGGNLGRPNDWLRVSWDGELPTADDPGTSFGEVDKFWSLFLSLESFSSSESAVKLATITYKHSQILMSQEENALRVMAITK